MKRIFNCLTFILVGLIIFPIIVFAEDAYVEITDVLSGSEGLSSYGKTEDIIIFSMNNDKHYEFKMTGYNLEDDEEYQVVFKSDFVDETNIYKGSELENGVRFSYDNGDSQIFVKVIKDNSVPIKYTETFTGDTLKLYFNENFDSTKIDEFFNSIAKDGKIKVDTIEPDSDDFYETAISASLQKYINDEFFVFGGCYDIFGTGEMKCIVSIQMQEENEYGNILRYKDYPVEFIYVDADESIKSKVAEYSKKFDYDVETIENELFALEDMETINFKVATTRSNDSVSVLNSSINYSSEFNKMLENSNITAILDARAGWDDMFSGGGYGFLDLVYDGVIYGFAPLAGIKQNNVIYVPDDTKDTTEDYINAALKRINEYMPDLKVTITYAGQIDTLNFDGSILGLDDIVDVSKTLGEYYKVSFENHDFYFFIAKDSSKMRKPIMITNDLKTNISITTEDPSVPLDSKVNAYLFDKDSKTYKEYINRLSLKEAAIVDLKLYSSSVGSYVEKLENGKFKVYIPLTEELKGKDLMAYYVTSDGKVEKHPVKIEGDYAVFETNHFSTYALGVEEQKVEVEQEKIDNPSTSDNIMLYELLGLASLVGILKLKKKELD